MEPGHLKDGAPMEFPWGNLEDTKQESVTTMVPDLAWNYFSPVTIWFHFVRVFQKKTISGISVNQQKMTNKLRSGLLVFQSSGLKSENYAF